MSALRVKSFRGPQVAAGAVALTVLVALLNERFADRWASGAHLAYTALAAAFVLELGLGTPLEGDAPRPYQTALYVSGFALALGSLARLADVLGAGGAGTTTAIAAVLAALAAHLATARRSPTGALLAGVSAAVAAIAFASWVANPTLEAIRWILLGVFVVHVLAALAQRDHRPGHAVQLVNVAGLAIVAIGVTALIGQLLSPFLALFGRVPPGAGEGWGWELVVLCGGFGLLAYAGVEYVRGPAVLGVVALAAYVLLAGEGDLLGWPLVLALAAGAMLVVGLRPTETLPPPPDAGRSEADVTSIPRP